MYVCTIYIIGHVSESDSIFTYTSNTSYDSINAGYSTYVPPFLDNMQVPADAADVCGTDMACIYDYAVTGDASFGSSTLNLTSSNENLQMTLGE